MIDAREPPVARSTREDPRPLSDRRAADLAAGHIAEACTARSPVRVFGLTGGGPHAGTVRWRGIPRGRDDAALLARTGRRATAMGTGVHEPPRHPLPDVGLPNWAGSVDDRPESWQATGALNPGSAHVGDRYVLGLHTQPPQPRDGTRLAVGGALGRGDPRATPRRPAATQDQNAS